MIVELLGPSGVGKTTLAHVLLRALEQEGWHSLADELSSIRRPITLPEFNEAEAMMLELRLYNLLKHKPLAMDLICEISLFHHHMTFQAYRRLHPTPKRYLSDEHIAQLFIEELNYLIEHRPDHAASFLADRAFIYLSRSPEKIVKNLKLRTLSGEYRSFAHKKSDQDLLGSIEWFEEKMPALISFFSEINTPFICIDMDQSNNEEIILDFLKSLSS
jgi:DNA polymerase III delta prime subunit